VKRLALLALLPGCLMTRYLAQASYGQLDLLSRARPLEQVIRDPETSARTAALLATIPEIKEYGRSYGLSIWRNYQTYADLHRPAAVWFVGSADPVKFGPRKWCFPIAGCFPGLGWFDEDDAIEQYKHLEDEGLDVVIRPAGAYSTAGWFPDPVLSTMLGGGDDALPGLVNVILHESVHATILIPDESFFNESLASYIADTLTDRWIANRYGPGSPEDLAHTLGEAVSLARTARTLAAYKQLDTLYNSQRSREEKLAEKAKIIDELVADLKLRRRPNNATLTEARLYNGGTAVFIEAHRACGDIHKFIAAAKTLSRKDFAKPLQDDLTPIGALIAQRCGAPKPAPKLPQ
jgi:predicted aminopeptidase